MLAGKFFALPILARTPVTQQRYDVPALRHCGVAALRLRRGHSVVRQ